MLDAKIDLAGIGTAVQGIGNGITDFVSHIQGKLSATELAELQKIQNQNDAAVAQVQSAIDNTEAASPKLFVAGWRPFIGWVCGIAIAYNFLLVPFGMLVLSLTKANLEMPKVDLASLWPLVTGMLGLGTMRTFEKINNAQGNH